MTARQSDLTRAEQTIEAVNLVRGLLGDRAASTVTVEVTRTGTYRITAQAGETTMAKHEFKTGR